METKLIRSKLKEAKRSLKSLEKRLNQLLWSEIPAAEKVSWANRICQPLAESVTLVAKSMKGIKKK